MKIKSTSTLFAAGLVSLAVFSAPSQAEPNHWNRFPRHDVQPTTPRQEIRKDWRELHKDRAELGRDRAEIGRDRADLRNLYRSRASLGAIEGKKAEIRQDVREINHDRREIRDNYGELLFALVGDTGRGHAIYRVGRDELFKLVETGPLPND